MALILLLFAFNGFCQRTQKVGVVLSGGGARGLAHLGVLKAMEENNIPIDYICGTSIGAIIGGLYASGYTLDEIEAIFFSEEFRSATLGKMEDDYLYFYKQEQKTPEVLWATFDTKEKLKWRVPISIVSPALIDYYLMTFFYAPSLAANNDFDSLMIPFFCVASDITNHKAKTFHSGSLERCIRASMTFPLVFSPVIIDSMMMYDGGLYNNFPTKDMIQYFKPDVLVGVTITDKLPIPKEGDLSSVIQNICMAEPDFDVGDNGILISPEVTDMSILNFTAKAMQDALSRGYEAGLKQIDEIRKRVFDSVSEEDIALKRQTFNAKRNKIKINDISIVGVGQKQEAYFSKTMPKHNNPIDIMAFRAFYFNLAADRNTKEINPAVSQSDNSYILNLNIKTKQSLTAKVGGYLSSNPSNYLFLGLDNNFLRRSALLLKTNAFIGRYYSSFMVGGRVDLPVRSGLYVEAELNLNKWNYYRLKDVFFQYSSMDYLQQGESNVQLQIGHRASSKSKIVASIGYGKSTDSYYADGIVTSTGTKDYTTFHNLDIGVEHHYYNLDDIQFPTKGMFNKVKIQYIYGDENFFPSPLSQDSKSYPTVGHQWLQFLIKHKTYFKINKSYSVGMIADIFYSFQQSFINYQSTLLNTGSFTPTPNMLSAFYPEYRANQYVAAGSENIISLEYMLKIGVSLRLSAYAFLPLSHINELPSDQVLTTTAFDKLYLIANATIVIKTPVGPISIVGSYHQRDGEASPFSASINFGYILFNRKNIER